MNSAAMKCRSFAYTARRLVALMPVAVCVSCMGFLDMDPVWHDPKYAVDRGIGRGGDEEEIARNIRDEFENYYAGPKTAEGLKNYMMKFGDTCETGETIVCVHRINKSIYVYKYFFDVYLGRRELSRTEYLVRLSFPKRGGDVIPALTISVESNPIGDPQ